MGSWVRIPGESLRLCWNNGEAAGDSIKQSGSWLLTISVGLTMTTYLESLVV